MFLKSSQIALALALLCCTGTLMAQEEAAPDASAADPLKHGIDVSPASVAIINGQSITWTDFIDTITMRYREHQLGTEALDDLLRMRIVEKNMADRKMEVTASDV